MPLVLHDLTASEDRRFSPFCWRAKLALAHKGIAYETRACRFTDIGALSGDGPRLTLPTIDDGDQRIIDSWAIAEYLETTYPDTPSLFPTGKEVALFVQSWADTQIHVALLRYCLLDVFGAQDAENQAYFRENREKRFGMSLEAFNSDRPGALKAFRGALQPIRQVLARQPFISGPAPAYADYIAAAVFLFAEAVDVDDLLEPGDPIAPWLQRVTAILGE